MRDVITLMAAAFIATVTIEPSSDWTMDGIAYVQSLWTAVQSTFVPRPLLAVSAVPDQANRIQTGLPICVVSPVGRRAPVA